MTASDHFFRRFRAPGWGLVLLAVGLLILCAGPALPGEGDSGRPEEATGSPNSHGLPSFREFVLVEGESPHESRIQVRVLDPAGMPVDDLDLSDFEVSFAGDRCADGRGLEALAGSSGGPDAVGVEERLVRIAASRCMVASFRPPGPGRRVIAIVVDISGSVIGREIDGSIPERTMKGFAEALGNALPEVFGPDDLFFFARFSSRFYVEGPTRDPKALERVLLRPWNRFWDADTPYYSMVRVLADSLKPYTDAAKAILMFSDCAPSDHPGKDLDFLIRETEDPSEEILEDLAGQAERLEQTGIRAAGSSLDHTVSLGIPVYNIHFPDPFPELRWQGVRKCREWVRRTGGDAFPLPDPTRGIGTILEEVRTTADASYRFAVRHDRRKLRHVKIALRHHPRLEVVYSREPVALGSLGESLVFKINHGTPQERLEAANLAARFDAAEIRGALVRQLERETYGPVREALEESVTAVLARAICSDRDIRRARAMSDLYWVLPRLDESRRTRILVSPLEACLDRDDYRGSLFEWWKTEADPRVRASLYAANVVSVRYDLMQGRYGRALSRAEKLGGESIRVLLGEFLDTAVPPEEVDMRIKRILAAIEPS